MNARKSKSSVDLSEFVSAVIACCYAVSVSIEGGDDDLADNLLSSTSSAETFRLGLALTFLVFVAKETGYKFVEEEFRRPFDVILWLCQTVPWHVAKVYRPYDDENNAICFSALNRNNGAKCCVTGNLHEFKSDCTAMFGKGLMISAAGYPTIKSNPLGIRAMLVRKLTTLDYRRN